MLYTLDGHRVEFRGDHHFVAPDATIIGRVVLEHESSVWFKVVIRGDNDPIVIGAGSNIQDGSVLHTDDGVLLTVGPAVTVGHQAMLHGCTDWRRVRSLASKPSSSIMRSWGGSASSEPVR